MELNTATTQLSPGTSLIPDIYSRNQVKSPNGVEKQGPGNQGDQVTISPEARKINEQSSQSTSSTEESPTEDSQGFSQEDLTELTELKARDTEVRAHEQAHLSAAGGHATGGASFTFQKGPDGNSYAVGGEVGIDLSKESDPSATIQKMQTIKRAAMAPASPSSTDRQVAAQAAVMETQARQELLQEQQEMLLAAEETSPAQAIEPTDITAKATAPSISSLKASLAAYEQMSAM